MVLNDLSQRAIKTRLKQIYLKTGEDIRSYDKEIEEMKELEKVRINDEKEVSALKENINFAEESLYEVIISNIEIDAILALLSKNFELMSASAGKNHSYSTFTFRKNGIDINLEISSATYLLIEEHMKK